MLQILKNNWSLIALVLCTAVFTVSITRSCSENELLKLREQAANEQIAELIGKNEILADGNVHLFRHIDSLEVVVVERDKRVEELEQESAQINREKEQVIAELNQLKPAEADSLLTVKYSNVPAEERSREILIDLQEGETAALLLFKEQNKVSVLKAKGVEQRQIIISQEEIIANLTKMNANLSSIIDEKDKIITDYKKHVRKLKWTRNGAIIGMAGLAVVLGFAAGS
jgi:hypothetical protein